MKHSIEADGDVPIALREQRRDLRTGPRVLESDDEVATARLKALKTFNFALALSIAALSFAACESTRESDPRTNLQFVQVATVQSAGPAERAFTGVVTARVQSNLGFRVPGKVIQRLVNTGDFVRRGQALMRIDRNDLALAIAARNAAVASTKARAIQTAADEGRYRKLLDAGVATRQSSALYRRPGVGQGAN